MSQTCVRLGLIRFLFGSKNADTNRLTHGRHDDRMQAKMISQMVMSPACLGLHNKPIPLSKHPLN